jgi:hypothetical protein
MAKSKVVISGQNAALFAILFVFVFAVELAGWFCSVKLLVAILHIGDVVYNGLKSYIQLNRN